MFTIKDVKQASNFVKLDEIVNNAGWERGCTVDASMTYIDNAELLKGMLVKNPSINDEGAQNIQEMIEILEAAEERAYDV